MMSIDFTTYNKASKYPLPALPAIGHGYEARKGQPASIVVHTTNNTHKGTSFDQEADFLLNSADVSAHYLIGKQGQIVKFLDPRTYAAWHAGPSLTLWSNQKSIGIELHVSLGELPTTPQKDALRALCMALMGQFGFPSERVETHRFVALPVGRKSDPEGWSNTDFYQWRASLITVAAEPWLGWGTAYPLDPALRGWKIPQCWLRNTWLGEARSAEVYMENGARSIQWFVNGWVVYEKMVDWAMAFKASAPIV